MYNFQELFQCKQTFFSTSCFWNRLVWNMHDIWRPASLYLVLLTIYKTKIIKSLKNGAPGSDEISTKILQLSLSPIMMPLSFLCNRSLNEGVFPSELKLANVLPLFKSGDVMLFNNYRPVSLLCTLSKVFEKVMYSRLLNFLDYHKILIGNQFGFRKLHSSYMALMLMMDQVTIKLWIMGKRL